MITPEHKAAQSYLNRRLSRITEQLIVGGGGFRTGVRKWYNPMRWIRGELYIEYIPPERIYKR